MALDGVLGLRRGYVREKPGVGGGSRGGWCGFKERSGKDEDRCRLLPGVMQDAWTKPFKHLIRCQCFTQAVFRDRRKISSERANSAYRRGRRVELI
jgi:hypothetical protein